MSARLFIEEAEKQFWPRVMKSGWADKEVIPEKDAIVFQHSNSVALQGSLIYERPATYSKLRFYSPECRIPFLIQFERILGEKTE